jgi:predicted RNase H-like nuclease
VGRFIGIDGFPRGWVAAWVDNQGGQGFYYSSNLKHVLGEKHDGAMIDIPIGLPERNYRACDVEAQRLLGPSVFPGIRRNLFTFETPDEANEYYWAHAEPGISRQLWNIRCKIREVDGIMTPARQRILRETHPELIFWRLNNKKTLHRKKTSDGRNQRLAILRDQGFTRLDRWLNQRWGTGIGRDDLIDACVCAIAARDAKDRLPAIAEAPDRKGLTMEMWY